MSDQNQQNQKEESGKILKQFNAAMKKVSAVLSGQLDPMATKKIPNAEIGEFVGKMLENRKKAVAEAFIVKLESLLNAKIEFDMEVRKKEQEFENVKTNKMKEFVKLANDAFKSVENINELERTYGQTLAELGRAEVEETNPNLLEDETNNSSEE